MSTKAPGEILELFRDGYLSMAETIDALDAVEGYVSVELLNIERAISDDLREQNAKLREAAATPAVVRADILDALDFLESAATLKTNPLNVPEINQHNSLIAEKAESVRLALFSVAATPAVGGEREALEAARQEIVLAIAFIGRDSRTDRLPKTLDGLVARLVKADQAIRAILAPPASPLLADEPTTFEKVRQIAFGLSAHQQYRLAFLISENIGYELKSNDPLAELSVDGHPLADRGDVA